MDRITAREKFLDIYRNRARGDAQAMTKDLHPEIRYRLNWAGSESGPPFAHRPGTAAAAETFQSLIDAFHFKDDWKVTAFCHDGDRSFTSWKCTVTSTATGKSHVFDVCDEIEWKDGMIISITQHTDTATVLAMSQ